MVEVWLAMEMSETPSSIAVNSTAATFGDDAVQDVAAGQEHGHEPGHEQMEQDGGAPSPAPAPAPRGTHGSAGTLVAELLARVPADCDAELAQDPNLAAFVEFHKLVKDFQPAESLGKEAARVFLRPIPKYNWDTLSLAFEHVYKLYTAEINDILADFDRLDIKRSIWQESAFRMDGERASRRFRAIETWISDSDLYVNVMRKDLSSSVQIIKHTLDKLNNPDPGAGAAAAPGPDFDLDHDLDPAISDSTPGPAKTSTPTPG